MNILHTFTRKSLLANRSRTLVTIIGIILSMSLFTAVIEGAYSGQQFLVRSVEEVQGRWLVYESGLSAEEADEVRSTDGVSESALWQEVGWGIIGSETNTSPICWWNPLIATSKTCSPSACLPGGCRRTRWKSFCPPTWPATAAFIIMWAIP